MKSIFLSGAAYFGSAILTQAATVVAPGDTNSIPGVVSFSYDSYYVLGQDHQATWVSDTDAYSWDHPNLASANPALGNQTGWTHLTRWVAFTLTEAANLTIRLDRATGVQIPDQGNPGEFVSAGADLIPAFTLWSGVEAVSEDASLGLGDPQGGHRWDNDGDQTAWADQLSYVAHEGNDAGADFVEASYSLAAGHYTINIAGHKPGAFDPGFLAGDLRKGFSASLTTIPEPGSAALFGFTALISILRRRR